MRRLCLWGVLAAGRLRTVVGARYGIAASGSAPSGRIEPCAATDYLRWGWGWVMCVIGMSYIECCILLGFVMGSDATMNESYPTESLEELLDPLPQVGKSGGLGSWLGFEAEPRVWQQQHALSFVQLEAAVTIRYGCDQGIRQGRRRARRRECDRR